MKVRTLTAAVALAATGTISFGTQLYHPGNAEEGMRFEPQHLNSGTLRGQIQQNVMGAQRDGSLYWSSRDDLPTYPPVGGPKLSSSRQKVLDELRQWNKNPASGDGKRDLGGD